MKRAHPAALLLLQLGLLWTGAALHAEAPAVSYEALLARLGDIHPDYQAMQGEVRGARFASSTTFLPTISSGV